MFFLYKHKGYVMLKQVEWLNGQTGFSPNYLIFSQANISLSRT